MTRILMKNRLWNKGLSGKLDWQFAPLQSHVSPNHLHAFLMRCNPVKNHLSQSLMLLHVHRSKTISYCVTVWDTCSVCMCSWGSSSSHTWHRLTPQHTHTSTRTHSPAGAWTEAGITREEMVQIASHQCVVSALPPWPNCSQYSLTDSGY